MLSILRSRTAQLVISNVSKQIKNTAPFSTILVKFVNDATLIRPNIASLQYQHVRFKSKKKKNKAQEEETETEEEEHDKDDVIDKHTKVLNASVSSMRLDLILKSGLGMARNKVETLFYESKIRLNGQKVLKKSETVSIGDEIDVVKGTATDNPDFLTVARVEIISVKPKSEGVTVKLRRIKTLTIENYEDKWKAS